MGLGLAEFGFGPEPCGEDADLADLCEAYPLPGSQLWLAIVDEHDGVFPVNLDDALALPGVAYLRQGDATGVTVRDEHPVEFSSVKHQGFSYFGFERLGLEYEIAFDCFSFSSGRACARHQLPVVSPYQNDVRSIVRQFLGHLTANAATCPSNDKSLPLEPLVGPIIRRLSLDDFFWIVSLAGFPCITPPFVVLGSGSFLLLLDPRFAVRLQIYRALDPPQILIVIIIISFH